MDHLGIDNVKGSGFPTDSKEADENDCQAPAGLRNPVYWTEKIPVGDFSLTAPYNRMRFPVRMQASQLLSQVRDA